MASNALGLFGRSTRALAAAGKLKEAGFAELDLITPVPLHGVDEVLGDKRSAIKRFTFFGAIIGGLSGFALAAGTAVLFIHPTGGRPVITIPPFLIITYELTILFGILATVLGFLISARLPVIRNRVYVPESAVDKFVVNVSCRHDDDFERATSILRDAGAEDVRKVVAGGDQ